MRSFFALLVLTAIRLPAQEGSAHTSKLDSTQIVRFNQISTELICQCGCNLVLGSCGHVNCPSALPMRAQLETMIFEGRSHEAILDYFMNVYSYKNESPIGRRILSQPKTEGFDLLAWTLPYALLAVFLGLVVVIVRKSSSKKSVSKPDPATSSNPMDSRIEEELKHFE